MNPDELKLGKIYASKCRISIYDHPTMTLNMSRGTRQEIPEYTPFVLLNYTTHKSVGTLDITYINAKLLTANGEIGYVCLNPKYLLQS